jgi:hypothetical protein
MKEQFELVKLIRELSAFRMQVRDNAVKQRAAHEKILEINDPVLVPKDKLGDLRKALSILSEEVSQEEWLKFAFDYGKQVNADLARLKEGADKAEATANEEKQKLSK